MTGHLPRLSGALSGPASIGPGLALQSASLAWDGSTFGGEGVLSVSANGGVLSMAAAFDFTDAASYAASLSVQTGSPGVSWTPVAGITITDPSVSGSVARDGDSTVVGIEIGASEVTLSPAFRLSHVQFALQAECGANCDTALTVAGTAVVSVGNPTTVVIAGSLDLATGEFSVQAAVADLHPIEGLAVQDVTLSIAGGGGSATEIGLAGQAVVFDVPATVVVELSASGFFLSATLGTWKPSPGAPSFAGARIVYSSFATTITTGPGGTEVELPAHSVYLAASISAPTWFTTMVGTNPGAASVAGLVDLGSGEFDVDISFNLPAGTELFTVGGVSLRIDGVTFRVASAGGMITSSLSAGGHLGLPGFDASTGSGVAVTFAATYSTTAGLAGSITAAGAWEDAFGVPDLVVEDLTVGVSIGGSPQLMLAGNVTLPPTWAQAMGLAPGVTTDLVASVGGPNSCFGIDVGPGPGGLAADIGDAGALIAFHLSVVVAPTGCTVGPTALPPGVSLQFDGYFLTTPVSVTGRIRPAPFAAGAAITIGDITVQGFQLRGAELRVDLSASVQHVMLAAEATVFGVDAEVAGTFSKTHKGTAVDLEGAFATPDLGGFSLDQLVVTLHLEMVAGVTRVSVSAEADIDILGRAQHVALEFTAVNGVITEASGNASISVRLVTALLIVGTVHVELAPGAFPVVTIDGWMVAGGHELTELSAALTGGGFDLEARLGTPLGFSSPPMLAGTIAWPYANSGPLTIKDFRGAERPAEPGDFRFSARNIGVNIKGFSVLANVALGHVGGQFWTDLRASLNLGGTVAVASSFGTNGDFFLSGATTVNLGGTDLSAHLWVTRVDGTYEITGDFTWDVPNLVTVRFLGEFISRNSVYGMTYLFEGTGSVTPGGYDFGTGTFRVERSVGFFEHRVAVSIAVDVPGFAEGNATMWVLSNGALSFAVKLRMQGTIGQILGHPDAQLSFLHQGAVTGLTMAVTADNVLGFPSSVYVAGAISSNHAYTLAVTATMALADHVNVYDPVFGTHICRAQYLLSGNATAALTGSADVPDIATATLTAYAWGKCGLISGGIGAELSFKYDRPASFTVTVKVEVDYGVDTLKVPVYSFRT